MIHVMLREEGGEELCPPLRPISDTAVGRVTPVSEGQAHMARTGDEYIYAFEGDYDFATEEWGPQDVRVVWGPVAPHGLLVRDDSGIESFEDLEGADFPRITANPSVNNKLEVFFAYGGLTWDDDSEEKVETVTDIAPGVQIGEFGGGPGQEEGETAQSLVYRSFARVPLASAGG